MLPVRAPWRHAAIGLRSRAWIDMARTVWSWGTGIRPLIVLALLRLRLRLLLLWLRTALLVVLAIVVTPAVLPVVALIVVPPLPAPILIILLTAPVTISIPPLPTPILVVVLLPAPIAVSIRAAVPIPVRFVIPILVPVGTSVPIRVRAAVAPTRSAPPTVSIAVKVAVSIIATPIIVDIEGDGRNAERPVILRADIDAARLIGCLDVLAGDPAATTEEGNVAPGRFVEAAVDLQRCADRDRGHCRILRARAGPHVDVGGGKTLCGFRDGRYRNECGQRDGGKKLVSHECSPLRVAEMT